MMNRKGLPFGFRGVLRTQLRSVLEDCLDQSVSTAEGGSKASGLLQGASEQTDWAWILASPIHYLHDLGGLFNILKSLTLSVW